MAGFEGEARVRVRTRVERRRRTEMEEEEEAIVGGRGMKRVESDECVFM